MEKRFREQMRGPERRAAFLSPRERILIVCEGEVTEERYFGAFQHHHRNRLVHVEATGGHGVPLTVVDKAIELRDQAAADARSRRDANLRWDQTWCVFDRDDHPAHDEACTKAATNGIELALSNPNFELWALLHFQVQTADIHRDKVRLALKKHLPRYDKELPFPKLVPGYEKAVERARGLDDAARRDGAERRNPTTGVYALTELIRKYGQP